LPYTGDADQALEISVTGNISRSGRLKVCFRNGPSALLSTGFSHERFVISPSGQNDNALKQFAAEAARTLAVIQIKTTEQESASMFSVASA
jgi:hypothetical protein